MAERPWDRRAERSAPQQARHAAPTSSRSRATKGPGRATTTKVATTAARGTGPKHARTEPVPSGRTGWGILGRLAAGLALVIVTVTSLSLFGFPVRTWLDQRRVASAAEQQLSELKAANADAEAQVEALQSDAEIEKLAREDYGYAKAGEEVYRVLPPARDPVRVPDAWPFNGLGTSLAR